MSIRNYTDFIEIRENIETDNFYKQTVVRVVPKEDKIILTHYQSLHGESSCNVPYTTSFAFPVSMLPEILETLNKIKTE